MQDTSQQEDVEAHGDPQQQQQQQQRLDPEDGELVRMEDHLKSVLKDHYGSTKHPTVKAAIDALAPYNPIGAPAESPLLVGDFVCHTIPEFPGRLKQKDKAIVQYTLGKLSFGVFQPHHLVCTVRSVRQTIRVRTESKTGGTFKTYDYPVLMDLTIHTDGSSSSSSTRSGGGTSTAKTGVDAPTITDLPAILSHDAVCYPCPDQHHKNQRLRVIFKGSTLMPAPCVLRDPRLLQVWVDTFSGAYTKAQAERNILSRSFRDLIAWWFQVTLPTDEEFAASQNHSVHFELHRRPPRGHLDILYLTPTTRITRGNRGTLVVVEPYDSKTLALQAKAPSFPEEGEAPDLVEAEEAYTKHIVGVAKQVVGDELLVSQELEV